jgi:hypothetical protein
VSILFVLFMINFISSQSGGRTTTVSKKKTKNIHLVNTFSKAEIKLMNKCLLKLKNLPYKRGVHNGPSSRHWWRASAFNGLFIEVKARRPGWVDQWRIQKFQMAA